MSAIESNASRAAIQHSVVVVQPGPPLGSRPTGGRLCGRIGGIVGTATPEIQNVLRNHLGMHSQILGRDGQLVVDHDVCWCDEQPVTGLAQWHSLVREGRLAAVEGAFALAWLDPDGWLVVTRDGVGERTLFYAQTADGVVFAANIKAILATGLVARELDPVSVATYLTYAYLPGRETLIRGIYEVLPGELVRFRDGRLTREPFWRVPAEPTEWQDEQTLRIRLRERLDRAVRRRLPAGETVGAFLSGGLDSSLVVALAKQLHDRPVKSYSVSFGGEYTNELTFSSMVADHCHTDHRIVELSPAVVLRYLDDTIGLLSDPIGDPLTVPNALLFQEAAADVSVVLNGEGGDPCFGGPKNLPMVLAELYSGETDARERSYLRAHLKCYDDLPQLLSPTVLEMLSDSPLEGRLAPHFADPRWRGFVTRLQALNVVFKAGHHILPKVDALSAPFGVLPRSPLFDRGIVEFSFEIPGQLKLRGSIEKYLLKESVRDLLPRAIVDRPKSGMLVPVEGWFRGPLLPQARERLLDGLAPFDLVRRDYLERLLSGGLGGLRPRHGAKIWLLVTLEAWLRRVFG